MSKKNSNALFTRCMLVGTCVLFGAACTLDTMGCGGDAFEAGLFDATDSSLQPDAKPDTEIQPEAGEDAVAESETAVPEASSEADAVQEDGQVPDATEEDVSPEASPESEPEAGPEPQPEASPEPEPEAGPEPQPEASPEPEPEAGPDAPVDAPEEPPTGICATHGHDGKIMVHTEVVLGPSAYLTVFGMLVYPGDAGSGATPFEGWCWSPQGGQGTLDCFPKDEGQEAPAVPKTKVVTQLGTTTSGPSGPPSYYLCDFGVCPVNVVFCSGKTEACRWTAGVSSGDVVYKEPGHDGKGELVCTLP